METRYAASSGTLRDAIDEMLPPAAEVAPSPRSGSTLVLRPDVRQTPLRSVLPLRYVPPPSCVQPSIHTARAVRLTLTRGYGFSEKQPRWSVRKIVSCRGRPLWVLRVPPVFGSVLAAFVQYHTCQARHPAAHLAAATMWTHQTEKGSILQRRSYTAASTSRKFAHAPNNFTSTWIDRACRRFLPAQRRRRRATSLLRRGFQAASNRYLPVSFPRWCVPQGIHRPRRPHSAGRRPVFLSRSRAPTVRYHLRASFRVLCHHAAVEAHTRRTARSRCTQSDLAAASSSGLPSIPHLSLLSRPRSYPCTPLRYRNALSSSSVFPTFTMTMFDPASP
ncbi:hypothetical protein GY45DRAFT_1070304 [Cubamyces sp. BRFM 1775]|nr:hypothetical protein GY45DRAFT_1070304 [Cubamyces sp. BRFM 1775]